MHPSTILPASLLLLAPLAGATGTSTTPTDGDLAGLREAFDAVRREAVATPGGFRLDNRAAGLGVGLDGRGLALLADLGGATWGLELSAWGRDHAMTPIAGKALVRPAGNRVTYTWGAGLDEWVVSDASGVEHGYTLAAAPAGGGQLVLDLEVRGELVPSVTSDGTGVRFLDTEGATAVTYDGLFAFDAMGRTLPAHLEPRGSELRLLVDDTLAVYPVTIDPKIQLGYLKALDPDPVDQFGSAIAVHGDTAVVGVPFDNSSSTGAHGDEFDNGSTDSGAAYVFVKNGATWTQQAFLKPSTNTGFERFGTAVAIHGDRIAVGAHHENGGSAGVGGDQTDQSEVFAGAVYVFYRFGLTWGQEAYVKATNPEAKDRFGMAVALSDDLLVVGAPYEDGGSGGINGDQSDESAPNAGAAYVYTRSGSSWSPALYLKAQVPGSQDFFGTSVAIEGTRIAVGSPRESSAATGIDGDQADDSLSGSGAVYIFDLPGEIWVQDAYVKASNPSSWDRFGTSVALDGDRLLVGAPAESSSATGVGGDGSDNGAPESGAAYVFVDSGGTWTEEAYLKASNTDAGDSFGHAVALSGDRLVVGAYEEDGGGHGIDAEQVGSELESGAAYVFERTGGQWAESSYLKASNPDKSDHFGFALGLSGSNLMVGAPGEDGGFSGPFADQQDDSEGSSGAAYAFDLDSPWGVERYGTETGANVADLFAYTSPLPNSMFTFELSEFNEPGLAFLMVSAAPSSMPLLGGTLLVDPQWSFSGPNGTIWLLLPGPKTEYTAFLHPIVSGYTLYAQAAAFDSTQSQGFAFTNGLSISIP